MIDKFRLEKITRELEIEKLRVRCTGDFDVDWRVLKDLQTTDDGRSLKATDDEKITRLAESLIRFGMVNNLMVWVGEQGDYYCFDAHHRVKALTVMSEIGIEIPPLPATRCLAESELEAKKLLLVKESRSSWVDIEVAPDYMREINFEFDVAEYTLDLPSIEWSDLEEVATAREEEDEKAEKTPDIPDEIHIQGGDLIELGAHRLLCGDSTNAADVERLMDGQKADMVFADPPYGVGYEYKLHNDNVTSEEHKIFSEKLLAISFELSDKIIITPGCYNLELYCCISKPSHIGCWVKLNAMSPGRLTYFWAWEPVFFYGKFKRKRGNDVFDFPIGRQPDTGDHTCPKPIKLWNDLVINFSDLNNLIVDPFLGSGTTLIAAEKTGRRCFGMEIDPAYCQVIVQRYVDFTEDYDIIINGRQADWRDIAG